MSAIPPDGAVTTRVERLEQFRADFEKKLYAAKAVAGVLGIATVTGGLWIGSLTRDLADLSAKTDKLQMTLARGDEQIANALAKLDAEKARALAEIDAKGKSATAHLAQESENLSSQHQATLAKILVEKRREATRPALDELVSKLTSGALTLVVRGIQVRNSQGNTAVAFGADQEGDGYLRINTDKGEPRYGVSLSRKRAQSSFYNLDGKLVLSVGVFNDTNTGYLRLRDESDTTTLLELKSDSKGGILLSYATNGKNIVYLGPESNTGNGLVNVTGLRGETTASHTPK